MADRFAGRWSGAAEQDVTDILEFVARQDGIARALDLYANLREAVDSLALLPRRARIVPELRDIGLHDFREILVGPYRMFFRVEQQVVLLLGVVDGRRDLAELLFERALRIAE